MESFLMQSAASILLGFAMTLARYSFSESFKRDVLHETIDIKSAGLDYPFIIAICFFSFLHGIAILCGTWSIKVLICE